MAVSLKQDLAREALRFAARSHRSGDERRCHALLELMETCQTFGAALRSELAHRELTENGFRALGLLVKELPASVPPSSLTTGLSLPPQAVSAVLGRLEVSRLITRLRDAGDRRTLSARATPRGVSAFNQAAGALLRVIARLMSALDGGDLRKLDNACARLRAASPAHLPELFPMIPSPNRPALRPKPALLASLLFSSLLFAGCGKKDTAAPATPPPMEVHVLVVAPEPVALSRELPGRTSAFRIAEVRARINGIVQKRLFTEGSDVKEGDVLFEIDPAPYQAALDSAQAQLARAEAGLASTAAQVGRFKSLVSTNAISQQNYDDAIATQLASKADVAAAKAAVRVAEINLGYTRVTSPISGRIGRAEVTEGAYVQQNAATLLATVQQLDPLYVDLSQSADEVLRLKESLASGRLQRSGKGEATLTLTLTDNTPYPHSGVLQFSDVSVNQGTGTVTLRGIIPNPEGNLFPGMFVRARLEEGLDPAAILLPQSVVSRNTKGEATTMIVGADQKVELRVIQASRTHGANWIISGGLKAGDRVITDNLQKIRPGAVVKAVDATPAAPAQATPAAAAH